MYGTEPKKKEKEKIMDVNGWAVIQVLLRRRRKNQSDLARLLGVTPAAITQGKRGDFQFGVAALDRIIRYLGATPEEQNDFYTLVIRNRLFEKCQGDLDCRITIVRRGGPVKPSE